MVLIQDECHLVWGDSLGYVWGARGQAIEVPMTNQRERQTYYGALNFGTRHLHIAPFDTANGLHTVAYLRWLQSLYPGKNLLVLWDGASYHRDAHIKAYLEEVNGGLEPEQWPLTLMTFAPHAPEQSPIEDCWLAGKQYVRRNFAFHKTFAQVKHAFVDFLQDFRLVSAKFLWYQPTQLI